MDEAMLVEAGPLRRAALRLATAVGGRVLALETTAAAGGICLADAASQQVLCRALPAQAHPCEQLARTILTACTAVGSHPGALHALVVGQGPGSFTGLRVGLATAHGLSWGSGARLLGVSSLANLALAAVTCAPVAWRQAHCRVLAALDARNGEVFAGLYQWPGVSAAAAAVADGPVQLQPLVADALWTCEDLQAVLGCGTGPLLACGDAAEQLPQLTFCAAASDAAALRALATLALVDHRALHAPAAPLLPRYLKACTAERALAASGAAAQSSR